jgi:hypothetical protein
MSNVNKEGKQIKKDQHATRDVREELTEEIRDGSTQPRVQNPNRDQARGDYDRSGNYQDEGRRTGEDK